MGHHKIWDTQDAANQHAKPQKPSKTYNMLKQGHAARIDPAQFDLFSSISVCSFATLPGFCGIRILT